MHIVKVFLTAPLSVLVLFIVTKLMGHKQVAQLDFFDYVNGITIGSIGAELATATEHPERPLIAIAIYGATSLLLTLLTRLFPKTRKFINGTPTVLMKDGRLIRENLTKAKLDLSEFLLLCREQGYFDLREIGVAVFEHNGKLSVLPKSQNRPLTPEDMKLPTKSAHIGTELIMDGRIMGENLSRIGRDAAWLDRQLRLEGYHSAREVFLAIYRAEEDTLTLYPMKE